MLSRAPAFFVPPPYCCGLQIVPTPLTIKWNWLSLKYGSELKGPILDVLRRRVPDPRAHFREPKRHLLYTNFEADSTEEPFPMYMPHRGERRRCLDHLRKAGFPQQIAPRGAWIRPLM